MEYPLDCLRPSRQPAIWSKYKFSPITWFWLLMPATYSSLDNNWLERWQRNGFSRMEESTMYKSVTNLFWSSFHSVSSWTDSVYVHLILQNKHQESKYITGVCCLLLGVINCKFPHLIFGSGIWRCGCFRSSHTEASPWNTNWLFPSIWHQCVFRIQMFLRCLFSPDAMNVQDKQEWFNHLIYTRLHGSRHSSKVNCILLFPLVRNQPIIVISVTTRLPGITKRLFKYGSSSG